MSRFHNPAGPLLVVALVGLLAPLGAYAQLREIVSKQIGVGPSEVSLRLEFAGEGALEVELRDGTVRLDGEVVGTYQAGDELEIAWRALIGEAVSLDGGALADHLRAWTPPGGTPAEEREAASLIDDALETALAQTEPTRTSDVGEPTTQLGATLGRAAAALIGMPQRLVELGQALEDLDLEDIQMHVGEDVVVESSETVPASIVMVDGDLEIRGEVNGDVVMVGGSLRLAEGGLVTGEVRVVNGRVFRDGGEVVGDVATVRLDPGAQVDREQIRAELRDELQGELRRQVRNELGAGRGIGRAIGELMGSLLTVLLVGVLGGGLAVHFARDNLQVVADTARRAPVRAGLVGLAGAFLTLPAWILGALGLIVSIVGILALPFWIVLFPIAVCFAAGVGYLAVAQGVGEWVAHQRYPRLDWVRISNPYSTVVAGVGALMLAFVASDAIQLVGFLRFISVLLASCGVMVSVAAVLVGFGAILLTRGGRSAEYAGGGGTSYWGGSWDDDLGWDPRPPSQPHAGPAEGPAAGGAGEATPGQQPSPKVPQDRDTPGDPDEEPA